ncbi:MAG: IS21-like element helper ATPase IstB [Candidatus Krumholzibacteriia bacterium]
MNEEIQQYLKNLRLKRILETLDEEIEDARKKDSTYEEFLVRLLRAQWHHRQEKALEWRIKRARLPFPWTLESFPFKKQPGVSRRQIRNFATLDFVPRAENIVFVGGTGVGKTGLVIGLLLKALQNGYRALFVKAQDLFDEMFASLADRSTPRYVRQLSRIDVLAIDEMGYLTIRPEQANVFFRLMEERYTRKPTLITTNLAYDEWHQFLGNPPMVDALLSRLRHRCHTVTIDGPSLREPQK